VQFFKQNLTLFETHVATIDKEWGGRSVSSSFCACGDVRHACQLKLNGAILKVGGQCPPYGISAILKVGGQCPPYGISAIAYFPV
jgi:hypothetical protein